MVNNYSSLMTMATKATNGAMSSLVLLTDVKVKANCPIKDIKKLAVYRNVQFGGSYENGVNNALERVGIDAEFEASPLKGKKWLVYPRVEVSLKDENQFYVRFNLTKNTMVESVYIVDGRKATDEEVEVIKAHLYASSSSAKQSALGLADADHKKPFSPKFESIVSWTCKDCYYNSSLMAQAIFALAREVAKA